MPAAVDSDPGGISQESGAKPSAAATDIVQRRRLGGGAATTAAGCLQWGRLGVAAGGTSRSHAAGKEAAVAGTTGDAGVADNAASRAASRPPPVVSPLGGGLREGGGAMKEAFDRAPAASERAPAASERASAASESSCIGGCGQANVAGSGVAASSCDGVGTALRAGCCTATFPSRTSSDSILIIRRYALEARKRSIARCSRLSSAVYTSTVSRTPSRSI